MTGDDRSHGQAPVEMQPERVGESGHLIAIEWRAVDLAGARGGGCVVSTAPSHALSVTVVQGAYRKTVTGVGSVEIAAIPMATPDTAGSLTAIDTVTGATVRYGWTWRAQDRSRWRAIQATLQRLFAARAQTRAGNAASTPAFPPDATRFFGIAAQARRFAFVLDKSGSMAGARWQRCQRELEGALRMLSPTSQFCVVLFSSTLVEPPRRGWVVAEAGAVDSVVSWIASVAPDGRAYPKPAFDRVFALAEPADVVYFLTDGELRGFAPADCAPRDRAQATVINTITLDDVASAAAMRQIASDSGGAYAHVVTS
jgi:hypothetical protein